jgi:hypothetical protein
LEVSITGVQAVRGLLVLAKHLFPECGKENAYSANIEFGVSAHGEHIRDRKAPTENSNRTHVRKWRMVEAKQACEDISVDMKNKSTAEREG